MFEKAGLDVTHQAANSGSAAMAAVVSGSYQIATVNLLSICNAHVRGLPISVVAPNTLYTQRTHEALLQVAADSPLKAATDLSGKILGVASLGDIDTLAVKVWVDKNGGDLTSIKFVEVPNAAMPVALAQHRVDAANIQPPVLDASLAAGTTKTIGNPLGAIANTFMIVAYVGRTDWAEQNSSVVQRFNRVLRDSANYVNTHYAETAALVADFTQIELSVVQKMNRTLTATRLDPAYFQPLIDSAAKFGMIAHPFPARELFLGAAVA